MKRSMKKILGLSTCVLSLCCLERVNAATLTIGNDTVTAGASREVTVELVDDNFHNIGEFQKIEFKLSLGTAYATVDSIQPVGVNFGQSGDVYSFSSSSTSLTAGTIGRIKYTTTAGLAGDFKITPVDVKFTKADGTVVTTADPTVKIQEGNVKFERPKSKNAVLSGLIVSQGTLSPAFSQDVTDYKVQVRDTINSIRITPTAGENGKVSGGGTKSLAVGENIIELTVTSEDGSANKVYTVNVVRGEIAEPSAYLKSLSINNIGVELSPEFDSKNNKYTVTVDKNFNELNFKYETEDPLAEVKIEGNENFAEGENIVTITVKSSGEEPKEQIYEITVIKEGEESEEESQVVEEPIQKKKPSVWLIVGIVSAVLAIVGGVTLVLFKKKGKDKKKNKKNDKKDGNSPVKTKKLSLMEDDEEEEYEEEVESDTEEVTGNSNYDDYFEDSNDTSTLSSTTTLNRTSRLARRDESVTDILKGELFEDEKTRQFDSHSFKEKIDEMDDDSMDKTKEFDFRDFE